MENKEFNSDFQFINSVTEHSDPWNDINKYIKRKAKTKLDDKIKKIRQKNEDNEVCISDKVIMQFIIHIQLIFYINFNFI